jgi:transcriptional regulator with XRE-family HTH domain
LILNANQIRAARALKNWSQADLAKKVDMATPSIGNIEAGKHNPTVHTQNAIRTAFEDSGIEFIEGGVRIKQDLINVYEGDDCYLRLLDDAYRMLAPGKGEILFSGSDESRSPPAVIEKLRAMRRAGITMRSLIAPDDTLVMGRLDEYRCMPEELFVNSDVKVIFGNVVAYLVSWQDIWKVIALKEDNISMEALRQFNYIWSVSKKPSTSTSKVKYED